MHNCLFKIVSVIIVLLFAGYASAQTIQILTGGTKTSIRGLSVVDDSVLWASGSNGMVARSTDGGKNFNWLTVKGYEQRDFRDVEAFDSNTAIIMAIAEPAIILKTKDGGRSWKKVFEDSTKGMFLDAMDFINEYGIVIGDPIDGKMFKATTEDYGDHWSIPKKSVLLAKGEAFFASSGTNVKLVPVVKNNFNYIAASGGTEASWIGKDKKQKLDLRQGKESQGANSLAVNLYTDFITIVVGGDFANDKDTVGNCVLIKNKKWLHPQTPPHGYRSCVTFITDKQLITCGTSGVDISNDGGMNWTLISPESFHVCQKAKKGNAVFLAGKDGRIARLVF